MADQFGTAAFIGMGREAVWGTAATITDWVRIKGETLKNNTPRNSRNLLGDPEPEGNVPMARSTAGGLSCEVLYQGLEVLFSYFFGAPTIQLDTPVAGANTWLWTPQVALYSGKGLTLEACYGDWSGIFAGHKWSDLGFSQEMGDTLQASFDGVGKSLAVDPSPTTASYSTDRPCLESEFTFEIDDVASTNIRGWSCGPKNTLQGDRAVLNSTYVREATRGGVMTLEGSWTSWYTDNVMRAAQNSGTAIKLEFIYTSTYFVTGTTPYKCVIEFPKVYILGETPPVTGPVAVEETNNFAAVKGSGGFAMRVSLVNGRTALPAES